MLDITWLQSMVVSDAITSQQTNICSCPRPRVGHLSYAQTVLPPRLGKSGRKLTCQVPVRHDWKSKLQPCSKLPWRKLLRTPLKLFAQLTPRTFYFCSGPSYQAEDFGLEDYGISVNTESDIS